MKTRILFIEDDAVDRMAFERFAARERLPYAYTAAGSVAEWMKGAVEHKGSWWPDWLQWLESIDSERVPARHVGDVLPPIEDAPGSYVRVRA